MQKYRQLKETLRSNFAQKNKQNSRQPDIEKIKKGIQDEFFKKLAQYNTNLN